MRLYVAWSTTKYSDFGIILASNYYITSWAVGIEVIDLRPHIFQIACGYFSLFSNHYLFPVSFRHDLLQSLGMIGAKGGTTEFDMSPG